MLTDQTVSFSPLGETLEDINNTHTKAYIPVIVFVICVIVVGFTSNALAFIFFSKEATKSSFNYFISAISLNDALVNLAMIQDSVDLFQYINNDNVKKLISLRNKVKSKIDLFPHRKNRQEGPSSIAAVEGQNNETVMDYASNEVKNQERGTASFNLEQPSEMKKLISLRNKVKSKIDLITRGNNRQDCHLSMATVDGQNKEAVMDHSSNEAKNQEREIPSFNLVQPSESNPSSSSFFINLITHGNNRQDGHSSMATVDGQNKETVMDHASKEARNQELEIPLFNLEQPSESSSSFVVRRKRGPSGLSETERVFSIAGFVISVF
ncbi:hypothetical protein ACF0H5_000522 [Mactra antiquata]